MRKLVLLCLVACGTSVPSVPQIPQLPQLPTMPQLQPQQPQPMITAQPIPVTNTSTPPAPTYDPTTLTPGERAALERMRDAGSGASPVPDGRQK